MERATLNDKDFIIEINRTIIRNALRDFCSVDTKKRFLVSDWHGTDDFKFICKNAEINPEMISDVFIKLAMLPNGKRKKEVNNLISTIESFPT